MNQSNLDQLASEKEQLAVKMEKFLSDEREVGRCLMLKVQDLNSRMQKLTMDNYHFQQQNSK